MSNKKMKTACSYAFIILLAAVHALGYNLFIIPNNFAPAGINGIATMIQYECGFSIGYMSILVNIPLCVFSFFTTDREFAVKTLVFSLAYSGVYLLLQYIDRNFDTAKFKYVAEDNTILAVILGGLIGGFVYGGCFKMNASTGGTDIISKYVSKIKPELNFFWITFAFNAIVAVVSIFVYTDAAGNYSYEPACLCLLSCFMSSFLGNSLIKGGKSAYKFLIITSHAAEIDKEIVETLKHSATKIVGTGVYSNTEKDVIICVINKHQIVDFQNILNKYDDTFAFVETVNETIGNFKRVK